ncbi:hypothetical protein PHLCEN_2v373 [Hermanssonia centrifuga]|uniref:Uncharacterized protein n=1 Tax=Hermanssonia centrifuga TaxID=98765 RepID=A0A2R6S675_9APHY|nr:hypothetical protein PHLCEN_2v373 [Hermanssonia centrifuga]
MHVNRARNRFGLCKKHGGGGSDCNSEEAVEEHELTSIFIYASVKLLSIMFLVFYSHELTGLLNLKWQHLRTISSITMEHSEAPN